ncbi:MAG: metallophosphoesterase family protein, partial [Dehalococcoidia bacterium]
MRALIVSDIHSNLEALRAVLGDAKRRGGFDTVWCLGDVVGYGPDPGPCIELLRQQDVVCVAGNHDYAAIGKISVEEFNTYAAQAARWTQTQLSRDQADFLGGLEEVDRLG